MVKAEQKKTEREEKIGVFKSADYHKPKDAKACGTLTEEEEREIERILAEIERMVKGEIPNRRPICRKCTRTPLLLGVWNMT